MNMTPICCANCGKIVDKPQKEITRQHKKGNFTFFCNRPCFREYQAKNHSQEWDAIHHRARYKFKKNNPGPHTCIFCSKKIHGKFDVHHLDNNHKNDNLENLKPAHPTCHNKHHKENYKIRKVRATGSPLAKQMLGLA